MAQIELLPLQPRRQCRGGGMFLGFSFSLAYRCFFKPSFSLVSFSHPSYYSVLLTEEDQKILKHMVSVEVEEADDVKLGYSSSLVFLGHDKEAQKAHNSESFFTWWIESIWSEVEVDEEVDAMVSFGEVESEELRAHPILGDLLTEEDQKGFLYMMSGTGKDKKAKVEGGEGGSGMPSPELVQSIAKIKNIQHELNQS